MTELYLAVSSIARESLHAKNTGMLCNRRCVTIALSGRKTYFVHYNGYFCEILALIAMKNAE